MSTNTELTNTSIVMDHIPPSSSDMKESIDRPQSTQRLATRSPWPALSTGLTTLHSCTSSNETAGFSLNNDGDHEYPVTPLTAGGVSVITPSGAHPNLFKRLFSRASVLSGPAISPMTPGNDVRFSQNVARQNMSRREVAEFQLYALLNDPQESLPIFTYPVGVMSVKEISKQLNTPSFIIERLLFVINSLSGDDRSLLTSEKNVTNVTRALNSTLSVRILLFFLMLDGNGNNRITKKNMSDWLLLYLENVGIDTDNCQGAVEAVIRRFYSDKDEIDFEIFYSNIINDQILRQVFSRFTINPTWFTVPLSNSQPASAPQCCPTLSCYTACYNREKSKLTPQYFNDNLSYIILLILYVVVNIGLGLYVIIYRATIAKNRVFLIFARLSGMLLNLNCIVVVLLMLKQTILYIRSKRLLRRCIPVDDHIDFHKFVGRFITVLAIVHTISHMINFTTNTNYSWPTLMFTTIPQIGWIGGFTSISGLILCIILAVIVVFSMDYMRSKGHSRIFYWSHRLYPLFYLFLILHAKDFWKWSVGPLVWLFLEKLYSIYFRYSSRNGLTDLQSVTIEKSNVVSLKIRRPEKFDFQPGDYIYISLPQIALHEYHPFTISSAPEEKQILTVHIQASGYWTKRVYQRFKEMSEIGDGDGDRLKVYRADQNFERTAGERRNDQDNIEYEEHQRNLDKATTERKRRKEVVMINGPYSSCARYIFDCEHVVLISGGIGVTPYASILSSLMAQFRASRRICSHCQQLNFDRTIPLENYRIRRVDFLWISRDYQSFEWFLNLLEQFEQEQDAYLVSHPNEQRFLTIYLYYTTLKADNYIGYFPLELLTQVWNHTAGKDLVTGLKAPTNIGRPDWNRTFTELRSRDNGSTVANVNVFFCGPSAMGKSIKESCITHHFRYYEEKF